MKRVIYLAEFKMDNLRPIKRAIVAFLTTADKGRLFCARRKRRPVLAPPASMADTSTQEPTPESSPSFTSETDESDYDSSDDRTQVPDIPDWPEGWATPAAKRKQAANGMLSTSPIDFDVGQYRGMWTKFELEAKKRKLESVNEESMWVESLQYRNVVALLEDIDNRVY